MRLKVRSDELRRRRMELFLSQEELAAKAGVSSQVISKLEVGNEAGIRGSTARALAAALGCEPADITELTEEVSA